MEIALFQEINQTIYAIIWRAILFAVIVGGVRLISEIRPHIGEKYPATAWNTKSVFKLLFLFLIIGYSFPFLGFLFHANPDKFLRGKTWDSSLLATLFNVYMINVVWKTIIGFEQPISILGLQKNRIKVGLLWGFYILLFVEILFMSCKYFKIAFGSSDVRWDFLGYLRIIVIGPIAEEVFFRGYMYPCFRGKTGIICGILFSTLCFMVYHKTDTFWFSAFISGIILCFIYEKSGSLFAPILAHISINAFVCIKEYYFGVLIYLSPWFLIWIIVIATAIFCYVIHINIISEKRKRCQVQR